jgi:hypothetical protein
VKFGGGSDRGERRGKQEEKDRCSCCVLYSVRLALAQLL